MGRGDELEPVACPTALVLVLVHPPLAVSTAWVYQQLRFELTAPPKDTNILRQCLESGDIEGLGAACFNDLEAVVLRHFPIVQDVKRALTQPGVEVCVCLAADQRCMLSVHRGTWRTRLLLRCGREDGVYGYAVPGRMSLQKEPNVSKQCWALWSWISRHCQAAFAALPDSCL